MSKVLRFCEVIELVHSCTPGSREWCTGRGRMLRPAFDCNGWKSTSKPDDELISTVPWLLFFGNNRLSVNLKMSFLNSSPLPMKGDGSSGVSESEVEQASYSDKLTGKGRTF